MSILTVNGSAVIAMQGQDSVAIASDLRYGMRFQTIYTDFSKVFQVGPRVFVGYPGFASDTLTVFGPYFVEPVVAGLDPYTNKPFTAGMDLIGCSMETDDFVVSGTCSQQMFGMCETLWEPKMDSDSLFECISQCMMNALDRDCASGWGVRVYLIEPDQVKVSDLKARMD